MGITRAERKASQIFNRKGQPNVCLFVANMLCIYINCIWCLEMKLSIALNVFPNILTNGDDHLTEILKVSVQFLDAPNYLESNEFCLELQFQIWVTFFMCKIKKKRNRTSVDSISSHQRSTVRCAHTFFCCFFII